jgi:hypothetical protein
MFQTDYLNCIGGELRLCVKQYSQSECVSTQYLPVDPSQSVYTDPAERPTWILFLTIQQGQKDSTAYQDVTVLFRAIDQIRQPTAFGIELFLNKWSIDNYVLMPAAAYNGNRFRSKPLKYPPLVQDPEDIGHDAPRVITDVPRLNINPGPSQIQQLTKDMATPAIGFYAPEQQKSFWLLTHQKTSLGESGIAIQENVGRTNASIVLVSPGVREKIRFSHENGMTHPSLDCGAMFKAGQEAVLKMRIYIQDCSTIQMLFDQFVTIRKDLTGPTKFYHQLPFSAAWKMLENKHNNENWNDADRHYKVGVLPRINDDWQLGWIGGMMSTYPMLAEGCQISRKRAFETFDFCFKTQTSSGFFPGIYSNGVAYGDGFNKPGTNHWHLIRKSADALYFIVKQLMVLKQQGAQCDIKPSWETGTRKIAEAFVRLWEKYGQFGQFVNVHTGDMLVGGSTCAAIAPAGLALASVYFKDPKYLRIAQAAAELFYQRDVKSGVTTGGPGEIAQCPDSESAFGLLESFVVLYEHTGDAGWLFRAEDMAAQCFTWCISYDFDFPEASSFGKLGMHSTGAVWASVQNKHGAPGICTLSGDSLFKLFRFTGNPHYLELIQDIAHNHTQYLSRKDRLIAMIPAGWMNERVELSDWAEPTGEISPESSWCEVSCMLTYLEIPGIYYQPDTGVLCVFDNIDVKLFHQGSGVDTLEIFNPAAFDAEVKILTETSIQAKKPLGMTVVQNAVKVSIPSQCRIVIRLPD